jgi:2-succinyl-6-hydroxy-2,4-cyclohexadiene-1-carboxylate synthase
LAARARRDGAATFVADWQAHPLVRTQNRIASPFRGRMLDARRAHTSEGLARCLECYGQGTLPALWQALEQPPRPILAVAGEEDVRYHAPLRRFAALPGVTTHIVPGAGHAAHLEAPEPFAAIVQGWAASLRLR